MTTNLAPAPSGRRPAATPPNHANSSLWWLLLIAGCVTFVLSTIVAVSPAIAFVSLAILVSIILSWWAASHGDALVVAVALLVFWAPFHTTLSQYNLGPQEVGVYLVVFACLILDRRGIWTWLRSFLFTIPLVALIAIGIFALACLQAAIFDHGVSLIARVQGFRSEFLYPVVFALLIAYTIRTRKVERTLMQVFFAGAVALAVYALTLKLWGVDIANGAVAGRLGAEASFLSQYHPNNIGLYFAFALPFALPLWREISEAWASTRLRKAVIAFCAILLMVDIVLAASRGTLVALAISALVALAMLLWLGTWTQRVVTGAVVGGALAGIGALILTGKTAGFGRYAALLNPAALLADPNVQFRLRLYARAWDLIKSHPLTGVGLDAFSSSSLAPYSPHDTYLDLWVSTGVFGLLAFLLPMALSAWAMFRWANYHRRVKDQAGLFYCLAIILAIVAFLAQSFTEAFDGQPRIAPVIWMFALVGIVASFRPQSEQLAPSMRPVRAPIRGPRLTPLIAPPPADWSGSIDEITQAPHLAEPPASSFSAPSAEQPFGGVGEGSDAPYGDHPPLPAPRLPAASRPTGASGQMPLPPLPPGIVDELNEDWVWSYNTGSSLMIAQDTLPLIDGAVSGVTEAIAFQREITAKRAAITTAASASGVASVGASEAEALLKRAPASFVWNQAYSLLIFALSFLLSIVIARGLSASDFGVYTMLSTLTSVLLLLGAMGLEDAAAVYVPRLLTRGGVTGASSLLRWMLTLRVGIMLLIGVLLAAGAPLLAGPLESVGGAPAGFAQAVVGSSGVRAILLGAYLAGSGVIALQGGFFASVLKTRATLMIGGAAQALGVVLTLTLMSLGYGLDGVFAAQALAAWLAAIAYLIALSPYLRGRSPAPAVDSAGIRSLMFSAWLTNISNGALGKQMDIVLMSLFAVSYAGIGFYNLAYQLVSVVGVLLISGLGGVSVAAMSVAYTAHGRERLISLWRAMIMLQVLLVTPFQVVTFVLADQIIVSIYGPQYAPAAALLRIFLIFSFLGRLLGGGANQSALYVLSQQRIVLVTRGIGFALNLILDVILIRLAGPAGALFATGFSQLWVGVVEYFILRREIKTRYPSNMSVRILVYSLIAAIPTIGLTGWAENLASALVSSFATAFPVAAAARPDLVGLIALVTLGALFVVIFLLETTVFRLGDARDLIDLATVNPRVKWLIGVISRRGVVE